MDYDDAALEEMLYKAHREQVCHSQREGLSVGQSSSVSERTGRPVEERTGRPVMASGQELNVANAQIESKFSPNVRRKLRNTNFQADYDRRSVRTLGEIIESQQEELHWPQTEELQRRDQQLLHERLLEQNRNYVKLIIKVSMKWKN